MARVTVGGKEYYIPELNLLALERAWPFIEENSRTLDPIKGPSSGLSIIAAGIMEAENFDKSQFDIEAELVDPDRIFEKVVYFFKKKIKASELINIAAAIEEIIQEAGLGVEDSPGEDQAATQSPSTAAVEELLRSSSPQDAKEEVGT